MPGSRIVDLKEVVAPPTDEADGDAATAVSPDRDLVVATFETGSRDTSGYLEPMEKFGQIAGGMAFDTRRVSIEVEPLDA